MRIKTHALTLALLLALAGAAQAADTTQDAKRQELESIQKQMSDLGRRMAELSSELGSDAGRVQMFRFLGDPDRAVIGVIMGDGSGSGVRLEGVTPDGPAEKAGLRAGDVITHVRGAAISGNRPALALREALRDMKAGDRVQISYERDGKSATAEITAERQANVQVFGGPGVRRLMITPEGVQSSAGMGPEFEEHIETIVERAVGDAGKGLSVMAFTSQSGLRLSNLNTGLGRYFGTTEGVLVLDADDGYPGLQAGDVIQEVDGLKVSTPREAMHLLQQKAGERPVELKVVRERVPQLVDVKVAEKAGRSFEFSVPPPAPPGPPPAPGQSL